MTYPPPPPPPGGFGAHGTAGEPDPRRGLNRTRNILIAIIVGIATLAIVASCGATALRGFGADNAAKDYITKNYQRDTSLDEGAIDAYVADGTPTEVASEISGAQKPTDQRSGDATQTGNESGSRFLQYPDYMVALFPLAATTAAAATTKVMLSRDYRTGYNHYHSYVGGFWVPTPNYSGTGSSNRGGGSGGGGK